MQVSSLGSRLQAVNEAMDPKLFQEVFSDPFLNALVHMYDGACPHFVDFSEVNWVFYTLGIWIIWYSGGGANWCCKDGFTFSQLSRCSLWVAHHLEGVDLKVTSKVNINCSSCKARLRSSMNSSMSLVPSKMVGSHNSIPIQ
jgi:hypothetical protein